MSLLSGYLAPDSSFALVGVDYRHSDGPNCTADLGGKLNHTLVGWAAGGGPMEGQVLQIAQTTASVAYGGDPETFAGLFSAAADRAFRELLPMSAGLDRTAYALVADATPDGAELHQVSTEGACWSFPRGRFAFSVLGEQDTDAVDAVEEALGRPPSLYGAVRCMSRGAVELTEGSPLVSPDLLLAAVTTGADGPERVTWKGRARDLAKATDEELEERERPFRSPQTTRQEVPA